MYVFQYGGLGIAILLPASSLVTSLRQEGEKSTCRPYFGEISQFTPEILLLPDSGNERPPCWNSISGFDFHLSITIGMSFCICPPNFVQIGPSATEL